MLPLQRPRRLRRCRRGCSGSGSHTRESGSRRPESKGKYLEAVIVVFEKGSPNLSAAAMLFQYLGNTSAGNVKWSRKGENSAIGSDFQIYKKGHSWRGAYRLLSPAESKQVKAYRHGRNVVDVYACRE